VLSRRCDGSQVLLIDARIANWLTLDERTIAKQMREHDYLLLRHLLLVQRLWHLARSRDP
jgi:hypothetical protein